MPTGREVINTIKEAFDFYSEIKTPWKDREVTLSYAAAVPLIDWVEQLERERDAAVETLKNNESGWANAAAGGDTEGGVCP